MFDQFDVKLLSLLQRGAEMTHAELSQHVHLSPTQCARRLEKLRKDGYISNLVAVLNPEKLGLRVQAHTLVSLGQHTEEKNEQFRRFIESAPEVLECYAQTGESDLIMKVVATDLDHLGDFLDRMIRISGGLASVKSCIVLKTIKKTNALPLAFLRAGGEANA
jgi:DNA-binding Lrp family transcriptional regulator